MDSNWIAYQPNDHRGTATNKRTRKQVKSAVSKNVHAARRAKLRAELEEKQAKMESVAAVVPASSIEQMIGNHALASSTDQAFLWARILYNPDLHAVSLFALSTDVNLLGLAGRSGPGRPCALLFRGQALLCIQKVSKSPQLSYTRNGTSTFTLCLRVLAAWEKVYGSDAAYAAHTSALRNVETNEASSDGVDERHMITVMEHVVSTIRKRFDDLPRLISSDGQLAIAPHLDQMSTRPSGSLALKTPTFEMFNHSRSETRSLLFLLSRLASYDFKSPKAWPALHEMCLLMFAWRPKSRPPGSWKLLDSANDLEDLALYHLRAGMVSILGTFTFAIGTATRDDGYFHASDAMDIHYTEMLGLETENLTGTRYAEPALWAIFMVTTAATPRLRTPRSLNLIRTLLRCAGVESFEGLESVLRKYTYREFVHRSLAWELYQAVNESGPSYGSGGLRELEISLADLMI